MSKQVIVTENAPSAIGTYSQAVRAGNTLYVSGQIPLCPRTMSLVKGGFNAQARQAFANLKAVVEAADLQLADVVKLTIFVTNLDNFAGVNDVMEHFFSRPYPARAVVEVSALPKASLIEMDAIVVAE
jgi:reactive intermediate/imine deaminase